MAAGGGGGVRGLTGEGCLKPVGKIQRQSSPTPHVTSTHGHRERMPQDSLLELFNIGVLSSRCLLGCGYLIWKWYRFK